MCNYFNAVLKAITSKSFYQTYVVLPDENTLVPNEIALNPKLSPYLDDAKGAFDGMQVDATLPAKDRTCYRNRKGGLSINVLAGCTMDMKFCYVLSGWEGCAADSAVFENARKNDLTILCGKYYLADAGFGSCDALLVPYRGVRYHLREWAAVRDRYSKIYLNLFAMLIVFTDRPMQRNFSTCNTHRHAM